MPQYLAIDYLTDILCRKQATLSRMLIVWPCHLSTISTISHNFKYRKPWLKGSSKFEEKELILDTLKDLSYFHTKNHILKYEYLQFNGIEYHLSSGNIQEIVPSSNPDSESETCVSKHDFSEYINHSLELETIDKYFKFLSLDSCNIFLQNDIFYVNNGPCDCKHLEAFLTTDVLQQHVPLLSSLLANLNVFSISDPIEFVETVMRDIIKADKIFHYSSTDSKKDLFTEFNITNLTVSSYELLNYEISEESMHIEDNIISPVLYDSYNKLKVLEDPVLTDINAEKIHSFWENCSNDIAKLIAVNSIKKCKNKPWIFLEPIYGANKTNMVSTQPLFHETFQIDDESLPLPLPLILEGSCMSKSIIENAKDSLKIEKLQLFADDFLLCLNQPYNMKPKKLSTRPQYLDTFKSRLRLHSDLRLSKYLLSIEHFPDFSKKNRIISYMIPEPAMDHKISFQKDFSIVHEASSLVNLTTQQYQNNLELLLTWDPVSHAADEMSFVRQVIQHEVLCVESSKKRSSTLSNVEDFQMILNRSAVDEDPFVLNKPASMTSISTSMALKKVEENDFRECTTVNTKLDETDNKVKKTPVEPCLDPLANFMMLMGKQDKNKLPWKTETTEGAAPSRASAANDGLKKLSVKRLRSVEENGINIISKNLTAIANEKDCPSKKLKNCLPAAQDTPSMLLCSEVVKRRKWSKKVDVCVTGLSLDLSCVIEREAASLLESLRSRDILSKHSTLPLVTRETTRYLIKQQQKKLASNENEENRRILLDVEIIDRIVSAFYLIVQVSFTSALALVHTSLQQLQKQEEHEISFYLREHISLLKRIIQKLKQRIDEAPRGDASHTSLIHPKTNELRQRLLKWHSKRKASDSESRRHVIVICCTVCRYLFMNLCKELSKPHEKFPDVRLRPTSVVIDVNSLTSSDVQSAFETNNVLILGEQMIFEDFPWDAVDLLVEYEFVPDSPWKSLSINKMIKHLALESVLPSVHINLDESVAENKFQNYTSVSLRPDRTSLVLIGSEKFSSFGNLLHLLETRYDVLIVERCYKQLANDVSVRHPDLIFDEQTCLLLEDVTNLQGQDGDCVKNLLCILTMQRKMFTTCFVIVMATPSKNSEESPYPLAGSTPLNIARLQASIKQLSNCAEDFEVKLIFCFTLESLAEAIHTLASKIINADDDGCVRSRSWIATETSKEEKFLLHFPCVNSFVAQRYLSVTSLREICRMDRDQFLSTSDALDIPRRIAQDLYHCLHYKYDVTELSSLLDRSSQFESETNKDCVHRLSSFDSKPPITNSLYDNTGSCHKENKPDFDIVDVDGFRTCHEDRARHEYFPQSKHKEENCRNSFSHQTARARGPDGSANTSETPFSIQGAGSVRFQGDHYMERKCSSQFPETDSSFNFLKSRIQVANEYNQQSNLDHFMITAQRKLNEFVRLNPDRIKCDPSTSCLSPVDASGTSIASEFRLENLGCQQNAFDPYFSSIESRHVSNPNYSEDQRSRYTTFDSSNNFRDYNNKTESFCYNNHSQIDPDSSTNDFFYRSGNPLDRVHPVPSHPHENYVTKRTGFVDPRDDFYATGTSGSTNIGVAQPFLQKSLLSGKTFAFF